VAVPTPVDQARWIALLYLQHSEIPSVAVVAAVAAAVGPRLQGLGTTAYTVTAFLLWPEMERIMSKTNDTSKVAALDDHRPLRDSELDAVSGGAVSGTEMLQHEAKKSVIANLRA